MRSVIFPAVVGLAFAGRSCRCSRNRAGACAGGGDAKCGPWRSWPGCHAVRIGHWCGRGGNSRRRRRGRDIGSAGEGGQSRGPPRKLRRVAAILPQRYGRPGVPLATNHAPMQPGNVPQLLISPAPSAETVPSALLPRLRQGRLKQRRTQPRQEARPRAVASANPASDPGARAGALSHPTPTPSPEPSPTQPMKPYSRRLDPCFPKTAG